MNARLQLPPHPRILVIVLRRLGDVLLATPLVHTLRLGLPGATVDMLVFRGTEGMLAGNPDVGQVLTISQSPTLGETMAMARRLWRRYDLAIATQGGDRPILFALIAASRRMGFVPGKGGGGWWKRRALHWSAPHDADAHRVVELLRISDALGLPPRAEIICPAAPASSERAGRYAVLHANPMFQYRRWTDAGWRALASALAERGLQVIVTGSGDPDEKRYLDRLWNGMPVTRHDGQLTWPELATLLRGAAVYVGPDTSVTHLAAGAGCPTVALYGPASPHRIGPWPAGGGAQPMWAPRGTVQHRGNVWVVQNPLPCLPCERLGCDNRLASRSQCLDELDVRQVLVAVDQALRPVAMQGRPE